MAAAWAGCTRKLQALCDGDDVVEPHISGGIDFFYPACAERRENFSRPETIARGQCQFGLDYSHMRFK